MNEKPNMADPEDGLARLVAEATNESTPDKVLYEHPEKRRPRTKQHAPPRDTDSK